jgi:hypothetical protein
MKRKSILMSALVVALVLAAFAVGTASATTGCFSDTNNHWAETFICWVKDNGIAGGIGGGNYGPEQNVTRAQMAVFLQALRTKGDTHINAGPSAWVPNGSSGSNYVVHYSNTTQLRTTTAGSYYFQVMPSLPSSMLNAMMYFKGAKVCYDATHGASITEVIVYHNYSDGTVYHTVNDTTARTDASCVTLNFTTAGSFWGGEVGEVILQVNFPTTADYVRVLGTTFVLSPSTNTPVMGPQPSMMKPDADKPSVIPAGSDQ